MRAPLLSALCAALLLSACATNNLMQKARVASDASDWDQAVFYYSKAVSKEPSNIEYRKALQHAKVKASQQHAQLAQNYKDAGAIELALVELRMAASLDPTNRFVADMLANTTEEERARAATPVEPSEIERLKEEAKGSGAPAVLQPRSDAPLTLNFPPNTKVKDIYTALGRASGINFLFDSGIRDQDTFSIDIANISFRKSLDQVAIANRHFYKSIDEHTLMVIPDNPQKRRDYEDNVIKTFYLSNASPNDVVNTLRGLLDARRVSVNAQLNSITIRDTVAKVEVMERIIETNDRPPSEVVIDVEIVEVRSANVLEYGTNLSSFSVTQVLEQTDVVNGVTGLRLSSIPFINASSWLLTLPSLVYTARKAQGNIKTLARPSLRALDGKQVTLRLGDQVPIETSTFSATTGGTVPLTRNFQFRDIGTNIDITPRVHHNNEVTLQLQVELTNIGDDPDGPAGPIPPTFGNRRINTEIRLKDGETNLLAGLFQSSDEQARSGIPILSDLPILQHLFTQNSRSKRETDIVLTLTPHIVRTPNIRKSDLDAFYVGTETNVGGVSATGLEAIFGKPNGAQGGAQTTAAPGAPVAPAKPSSGAAGGAAGVAPAESVLPAPGPPAADAGSGTPAANQGRPAESSTETEARPSTAAPAPSGAAPGNVGPAGPAAPAPVTGPVPTPPRSPAVVAFSPPSATASLGSEVAVDVVIEGASGVAHAPFYVSYDPAVLEFLVATEGGFLRADGKPTQFLASGGPSDGRVVIGLSRVGRVPGVDGRGVLATLRFRAKAQGSSPLLLLSLQLRDFAQNSLLATAVPGTVTVP